MSKFTTEVRWICESFVPELNWQGEYEHSGYGDVDQALQAGYEHIFDFDFPIWKESYREHLCKLILLHYYTREIAYETYALWKLHLRERLVAIMPKYNLLYKQEELANPFDNIKHTTVGEDTTHTNNNSTSHTQDDGVSHTQDDGVSHGESTSTGWNKYNETPQGGIEGLDTDKYLTNATKTTSESTSDGTAKSITDTKTQYTKDNSAQNEQNGKRNTEYTYTGRSSGDAYFAEMTKMYKNYESVDNMVLHELEDLFFGLWE